MRALDAPGTPAIGGSGIWGSQGDLYNAYAAALKGRQVLLLLDNALDASHVAPLLASRASSCCVVVTSRDRDQGFADPGLVFPIDVLYRAASIDLLSQIARDRDGKTPSSEAFFPLCAELAQLCDDVPLALRLVAAQVSSRPEAEVTERLQYLVTRLQAESTRLDRMRSGERAVRAAIRLSYLNLDDGTRRLLRLSCTARGSGITSDELGYCLELATDIVEDGLNRLVDRSLAMQVTRQHGYSTPHVSFGLFELVRLFADERRSDEETAEIITEVRRRFTMYMRNRLVAIDRDPSDPDLSTTLDPAAMLTALQLADEFDWTDLGLELAMGLCSHLDPSTEPDRLQLAHEIHISLYLRSGKVSNAILTYLRYAALLKDVGRTTEAAESARSARALATQHELVDLVAEANFQLSLLAAVQEEWAEALEASETAAGTLLQHAKRATALPSAINCCGFARNLDDYGRALHWARTAVDLADRVGGPSQRADASFELGMSSDDNQEILRAFNKARSLYEQVGNFSNAAVAAGNAARNTSNHHEMIELLRIATELWKRTEHVTRLATSLVAMSAALAASHNLTDAAVALNEAIRELTADDTDEGLIHDDVALRLLLEIRARYVALQLLLGTRVPGDVEDFDNSERVEEAQLTVEIAVLRDLCHGAKASWGALDMLRSFVSQEPKNPAHPFSAWWYDELGTEPSGGLSLELK